MIRNARLWATEVFWSVVLWACDLAAKSIPEQKKED